jgi:hypothetical protein
MIPSVVDLSADVVRAVMQILTGRLFSDETIRRITSNTFGKYLADWLPQAKEDVGPAKRIDAAKFHIDAASQIVRTLKNDLDSQASELKKIESQIEQRKADAAHFAALAQANQESVVAFRKEVEESLRKELTIQANKGRRIRQVVSFMFWLITLVLGSYLPAMVDWIRAKWAA